MGVDLKKWPQRLILCAVMLLQILVCTLPMGLSPMWNGERERHLQQYAKMAEALLQGHVWLDYDVDPRLGEMENPYDPEARRALGMAKEITYEWDHAYYNGHYYMYFGIVPTLVLFLPFRLVTGRDLNAYHATEAFTVVLIISLYTFFRLLAGRFFPKMRFASYLMISCAVSSMTVWFAVAAPALYCTAITGGISFMLVSLTLFFYAVYVETDEIRQIIIAFFGSVFGALVFGIRPPVALSNLLVIPLLVTFLSRKKRSRVLLRRILFAASPYPVVAALLMYYNYIRFENPFEFGQLYQLTEADQHLYSALHLSPGTVFGGIYSFLFQPPVWSDSFPFIGMGGVFMNYPFLFLTIVLFLPRVRMQLSHARLLGVVRALFVTIVVTILIDTQFTPVMNPRYRMEVYWLLGILFFIAAGALQQYVLHQKAIPACSALLGIACAIMIYTSFLLYLVPFDGNIADYDPDFLRRMEQILLFR